MSLNEWKHITLVRDANIDINYMRLYIGGIFKTHSYSNSLRTNIPTAAIFNLGGNPNDSSDCAKETYISDLRIYNTVLYPPEVRKVYNKGKL